MFRLIRACEIARANVLNGTSPIIQARPTSPWKSRPPSANSSSGATAAGLPDHRRHPVAPELVAVPVEEDVMHLLELLRREELGIRGPEDRLGPPRAELAQPLEPAFRVRDDEVVLGRIGAVVVVEAGVHAAELGQAHRHVAVVEDDGTPKRSRRYSGIPRRCAIGTVKTITASTSRSLLEHLRQMPPPARRDPAADRLARDLVERRLVRASPRRGAGSGRPSPARGPSGPRAKLSPSTQVGLGAVRHHGDSTGRPR